MSRYQEPTEPTHSLDGSLTAYFATCSGYGDNAVQVTSRTGIRSLVQNVITEIERLEMVIMQQCLALENVEQSISDLELDVLDAIFNETLIGAKNKPIARFTNDHQRRYEQRSRLRKNASYASLQESRRGMTREKARLSARLHKLEGYRAMLIADLSNATI